MKRTSKALWHITINDGFTAQTYAISGTDKVSIDQVMKAAKRYLKGNLLRQWSEQKREDR